MLGGSLSQQREETTNLSSRKLYVELSEGAGFPSLKCAVMFVAFCYHLGLGPALCNKLHMVKCYCEVGYRLRVSLSMFHISHSNFVILTTL
jgi:hypothetical protein